MARRAVDLQAHEQRLFDLYHEQRRQLVQRFGELKLEIAELEENLKSNAERQRTLLTSTVARAGMEQFYQTARIEGRHLVCEVPEELPQAATAPVAAPAGIINGRAHDDGMAGTE